MFAIPARLKAPTRATSSATHSQPQSLPLTRLRAWFDSLGDALVLVRADATRNRLAIADSLFRHMDRRTGLSRPTHKVIAEETGLGDRTVTSGLRWLQDAGFAVREEPGRTARYAAPHLRREGRNQAAVYRLVLPDEPAVDGTCHPSLVVGFNLSPRARGEITRPPNAPRGATSAPRSRRPAADRRPSRRELRRTWHQQQAQQFRERAPTLRGLSDAHLASRIRPFLDAGHTVEDLVYALDHKPDGTSHRYAAPVRCPAGWLRSRLEDHWRAPDGTPLPGHRRQLQARAEADRRRVEADLDVIHCRRVGTG